MKLPLLSSRWMLKNSGTSCLCKTHFSYNNLHCGIFIVVFTNLWNLQNLIFNLHYNLFLSSKFTWKCFSHARIMERNASIQFVMNLYLYLVRMNAISMDLVAKETLGNAIYHISLGNCRDCWNINSNNLRTLQGFFPWLVFHIVHIVIIVMRPVVELYVRHVPDLMKTQILHVQTFANNRIIFAVEHKQFVIKDFLWRY